MPSSSISSSSSSLNPLLPPPKLRPRAPLPYPGPLPPFFVAGPGVAAEPGVPSLPALVLSSEGDGPGPEYSGANVEFVGVDGLVTLPPPPPPAFDASAAGELARLPLVQIGREEEAEAAAETAPGIATPMPAPPPGATSFAPK